MLRFSNAHADAGGDSLLSLQSAHGPDAASAFVGEGELVAIAGRLGAELLLGDAIAGTTRITAVYARHSFSLNKAVASSSGQPSFIDYFAFQQPGSNHRYSLGKNITEFPIFHCSRKSATTRLPCQSIAASGIS